MLPKRGNRILDSLAEGEFSMRVKALDEERLHTVLQRVANRVTLGIIIAATILGAAMMMRVPSDHRVFGYPAIAMLFFTFAVLAGRRWGSGSCSPTARSRRRPASRPDPDPGVTARPRAASPAAVRPASRGTRPASRPDLDERHVGEAGLPERPDGLHDPVEAGPHGMDSATSSGRTYWLAANPGGVGRSAFTLHPPANQRNCSCARVTAVFSSGSQQIGTCPIALAPLGPIRRAPSTAFHDSISPASGSTATRWSASGAEAARWPGRPRPPSRARPGSPAGPRSARSRRRSGRPGR